MSELLHCCKQTPEFCYLIKWSDKVFAVCTAWYQCLVCTKSSEYMDVEIESEEDLLKFMQHDEDICIYSKESWQKLIRASKDAQ